MKTINDDQPIKSKDKDLLNRNGYAERVASFLMTAPAKNGLVVSVNGKWGSGKTSFLNLVKRKIEEDRPKRASRAWTDDYPIIVDFAPWCARNQKAAVRQFFDALIDCLPTTKRAKAAKCISRVAEVLGVIAPDKVAKDVFNVLAKGLRAYSDSFLKKGEGLAEKRAAIVKELDKDFIRYIVFIDDLDRLSDKEIRLVIQLIKAVCNFPNTVYVLAFDRDIVAGSLSKQQTTVDGGEYLKKIVQMEYNIPAIKQSLLNEITTRELFSVIGDYAPLPKDKEELNEAIGDGLLSGFQTIRDEKLFLNRVQTELDSFAGEIALADLVGIAYLRFLNPRIIGIILEYQGILLGQISPLADRKIVSERKNELMKELKNLPSIGYAKHQLLYERLFPNIGSIPYDKQAKHIEGRICSFEIFHKYLQMDYEDGDLSLRELHKCFANPTIQSLNSFGSQLSTLQMQTFFKGLAEFCEKADKDARLDVILGFCLEGDKGDSSFNQAKGNNLFLIMGSLANNVGLEKTKALLYSAIEGADNLDSLIELQSLSEYDKTKGAFDDPLVEKIATKTKVLAREAYEKIENPLNVRALLLCRVLLEAPEELQRLFSQKGEGWKRQLVSSFAGPIGSSYSTKMSILYGPLIPDFKEIIQKWNIDLFALIEEEDDLAIKQRLVLVSLLAEEENLPSEIKVVDLKRYCEKKGISFEPSDNYER